MNSNKYSKSLKTNLANKREKQLRESLDSAGSMYEPLKEYYTPDEDVKGIVGKADKDRYFPSVFKNALGDTYKDFERVYKDACCIHNEIVTGGHFPKDIVEWSNYHDFTKCKTDVINVFINIGERLAYKKRRLSVFDAQRFLCEKVLVELDNAVFSTEHKLRVLFEHAIDVLAQTFLDRFIKDSAKIINDENWFNKGVDVDFTKLTDNYSHAEFIAHQILNYNYNDYFKSAKVIDEIVNDLPLISTKSRLSLEDAIFDVFEIIPLYIKSFDTKSNAIRLSDKYIAYPSINLGVPVFAICSEGAPQERIELTPFKVECTVNGEFRLYANLAMDKEGVDKLGEFLIYTLHEKLLSFYANRNAQTNTIADNDQWQFTYEYHQALLDYSHDDVEEDKLEITTNTLIPSMSMLSFFRHMEKNFSCSVESGKGSEMKIWRSGTRIYTIGRHKRDQKIPSFLIRKILKRLEIDALSWMESFKKLSHV